MLDDVDADEATHVSVPVLLTRTLMTDVADRERLARETLAFAGTLAGCTTLRASGLTISDGGTPTQTTEAVGSGALAQ